MASATCFEGTWDSSVSCKVVTDRIVDDDRDEDSPPPLRRRRDLDAWASEFMIGLVYESLRRASRWL